MEKIEGQLVDIPARRIIPASVTIENGRIVSIEEIDRSAEIFVPPGFIDAHAHFPQMQVIASWGAQLLDWLSDYTFPEETCFSDPAHAEAMEALSRSLREQADELSREATRLLADTVEFDATVAPPEIEIVPFEAGSLDQHEVPLDEIVLEDPAEPAVPDPAEPLSEYSPGARLLATQMAISGASREMVRERLIHDFDTAEPDALLDSIFGPG